MNIALGREHLAMGGELNKSGREVMVFDPHTAMMLMRAIAIRKFCVCTLADDRRGATRFIP